MKGQSEQLADKIMGKIDTWNHNRTTQGNESLRK
jgi:hypothetical protein